MQSSKIKLVIFTIGEVDERKICIVWIQKSRPVIIHGLEGDFEEEPVSRSEVEVGVKRLKNGKSTGKNVVTDEKIKSGSKLIDGFI